ncbi:MAG: SLC13 family permease [Ignavibacterium sp.]|nr:SLC13 family permease [Ignavibacterium sp.]
MNKFSSLLILIGIIVFLVFNSLVDLGDRRITITAGVAILMAFWWMTETLPLYVTALIPLIIFPLTGVLSASKVSDAYINSTIFLFIGGFLIAIAIETWNLHKRIALKIILFFGAEPTKLLFGFMIASAFLSMWISNTATIMMMLPVAFAVLKHFEQSSLKNENLSKALLLSIAYSCSIGGIATLVGTQPNLVFVRITKISFPNSPTVSFFEWMLIALPISVLILILTYFLVKTLFRISDEFLISSSINKRDFIKEEYKKLGRMSYEEKVVTAVFLTTIFLWITKTNIDIGFIKLTGWANILKIENYVDDSTVAIFSAFILFVIPATRFNSIKDLKKIFTYNQRILSINSVEKIPWNVILLFGGGFALASAFTETGLSILIGSKLKYLSGVDELILILVVSITINFLTELTSNTAVTQMILPILASISLSLNIHPFLLMIPATIAASMAFMLPAGTPPNTIVFSSNKLKIIDMVKTGFILNLVSTIVISITVYYLGNIIFKLNVFPQWAR